jgi:hypothetical protein
VRGAVRKLIFGEFAAEVPDDDDAGGRVMPSVTSAVVWPDGKIYFFSGTKYYRYTPNLTVTGPAGSFDSGFPLDIDPPAGQQRYWDRLTAPIDGAILWPTPIGGRVKAYFFQAEKVFRYDVTDDKVDVNYPKLTRDEWPGFFPPGSANSEVNTAVAWPPLLFPPVGPKVYFFQRSQYYAYDVLSGQGDPNYPRLIAVSGGWPGLWSSPPYVKAAFVWPTPINGSLKAFFFQYDLFAQVDVGTRKVDANFPKQLQGNWPGF